MYKRPLRYDLPAADMMLQVLNFTNKTAFEKRQLTFGKPAVVTDETHGIVPEITNAYDLHRPTVGTLTRIEVKPTPITGWSKSQWLLYRREIIQDHFIAVPFVLYGLEATKAVVLQQLHEQYRLYLDDDLCDVEFQAVDLNDVLFMHHMGSIVENSCGDYVPPIAYNAIVKIRPEHPYWMGQFPVYIREAVEFLNRPIKNTLEIHRYLGPEDHNKIPAELMLRIDGFVDKDYYVRGLKEGSLVGKMILDVVKDLTQDPWVFDEKPQPFNLYGTTVIHNGINTGELYINDPRVTNVMVLQFSDNHCTNIRGQWVFGYYNEQSWLRKERIDALPIQDQ